MNLAITLLTAGAMGVLLVLLASRVSQLRMSQKIAFGDGGNPALMRAIRTHGNTAEHVPIFMVLLLVSELALGSTLYLGVVAALFVLGRVMFAIGVLGRGLQVLRIIGAGITYALQLLLAVTAIWTGLS